MNQNRFPVLIVFLFSCLLVWIFWKHTMKQIDAERWAEVQPKTAVGKLASFKVNDSFFSSPTTTVTMQDGTILTVYGTYSVVKIGGVIEQPFAKIPEVLKDERLFCIEGECRMMRNK